MRCGASFRCSYRASRLWTLELGPQTKLLRLEVFRIDESGRTKIGQCAIGLNSKIRGFADAIQLLPDSRCNWGEAMEAVLRVAGCGTYQYGSDWNLEASRAGDLEKINGVEIKHVHPVDVIAVDFRDWPDWDCFYREVSNNAKRNVKKAQRNFRKLQIEVRRGFSIYRDLWPLQVDRYNMFRRKKISTSKWSLIFRSGARVFATRNYSISVKLTCEKVVARYLGIEFGQTSFYFESASAYVETGASTYLLKTMIEDSFIRTKGKGIFIFGPDDHRQQGQQIWENLVRSRAQWNGKAYSTALIEFQAKM